ncbi:MAG TPA: DUF47 domain-containing protein [Rhodobiaceae bacterium]|nr:DUF47 domain-containing protein [Rhodobiaceae bacterium]
MGHHNSRVGARFRFCLPEHPTIARSLCDDRVMGSEDPILKHGETISTSVASSLPRRLFERVFPKVPDFQSLLTSQCALATESLRTLSVFMQSGSDNLAREIRRLEHDGDKLKAQHIGVLNQSFATPYDREDIYRSIMTIDECLNYAKTTVREMEILNVGPDRNMLEMAERLYEGAKALEAGFAALKSDLIEADVQARHVLKTERLVEKAYRRAIADLFDPKRYMRDDERRDINTQEQVALLLVPMEEIKFAPVARSVSFVMDTFKRREVYRHLSNTSDHMAAAAGILRDIIVKDS